MRGHPAYHLGLDRPRPSAPQVDHRQKQIVKNGGTRVRVTVDAASSKALEQESGFLQNLVREYSLFNPHATFVLVDHGKRTLLEATDTQWEKWLPTDPTSAHWYNQERLFAFFGYRGCKPKPRKFYNAFDISLLIRIQALNPARNP